MANITLRKADQDALEKLVDRYNLSSVLDGLAEISYEKAAHLEVTWNDLSAAKRWVRVAKKLGLWALNLDVLDV